MNKLIVAERVQPLITSSCQTGNLSLCWILKEVILLNPLDCLINFQARNIVFCSNSYLVEEKLFSS